MSAFANTNIKAINAAGVLAFEASGLAEELKTNMQSTVAATAIEALDNVKALCEGVDQWIEPYMLDLLPAIMDNLALPKTHDAAMAAGNAILHKSNAHSIRVITNLLYESFTSMKWQTKKGGLVLLGALGTHHPIVVQRNLPEMILRLIGISSDVKKEVKDQTRVAFTEICATITNVDIIPIIPRMIAGYMDPVKLTNDALDALVSTTFINDVDLPTLGLLVPILTRGMRERMVNVKRRAALVIGNMCKLVNDPRTAAQFYPILKPVLERGIEEIAVAEVRKVCEESLSTLVRVGAEADILSDAVFTKQNLIDETNSALSKNGIADPSKYSALVNFIASTTHFLVLGDNRAAEDWEQCIVPYVTAIVGAEKAAAVCAQVTTAGVAALSPEKVNVEDDEEDLCNATFSLAYGTRVLLHQTPFKVKIGRKYGLVGPNGAGTFASLTSPIYLFFASHKWYINSVSFCVHHSYLTLPVFLFSAFRQINPHEGHRRW
jgi:elongation factor 3